MNQTSISKHAILAVTFFSLYPYFLQAETGQAEVFNTRQGYLPVDYLEPYPPQQPQCPKTGSAPIVRASFQSAGAVLESFAKGYSVLYQAMFAPYLTAGSPPASVVWTGDLRALLIDENGRWRSDNGDKRLGSFQEDPLVESCFDASTSQRRFRLTQNVSVKSHGKCNALNFPDQEKDIGYLWRAAEVMATMAQEDAAVQRHPFQKKVNQRFIRTHIGQKEYDFVGTGDFPFQPEWFGLRSAEKATQVIDFIRGREHSDWRSRTLDQHIHRLGDTLNSKPVHVARPSANFHLLYADASYQQFLEQYRNRRARIFLSTHDGLLHAFNAGWHDPVTGQMLEAPMVSLTQKEWKLGQEIWAFAPFNTLPLLAHYADKRYGKKGQEHLNVLSQASYVFDARIFKHSGSQGLVGQADRLFKAADGSVISYDTHPGGWGTLMVTGFGMGGGAFATRDANNKVQLFQPGYLVFDITDAEQAPKLLASLEHQSFGRTSVQPAVITRKNKNGELDWYLVLGSGAGLEPKRMQPQHSNQSAKLFVYNLHQLPSLVKNARAELIDLAMPASIVAGMSSVDWLVDGASDALYVAISGLPGSSPNAHWRSALWRISPEKNGGGWRKQKLLNLNAPLSFRPQLSIDKLKNRWIYLASGLGQPNLHGPAATSNSIVGLKEERDATGSFYMDKAGKGSPALSISDLLSVEAVKVNSLNGELQGALSISPALSTNNALELERRIMQYEDASAYLPGWHRALHPNEGASSESSLFGGFLSQTTLQRPSGANACQASTLSFVHQLRFTTGTAWFDEQSHAAGSSAHGVSRPVARLAETRNQYSGAGGLSSYLLQVNTAVGKVNNIASDQNGDMQTQEASLLDYVVSGEVSWREL